MSHLSNIRGTILAALLLAPLILAISFSWWLRGARSSDAATHSLDRKVVAEGFASELLDLFRSESREYLRTLLAVNPTNPAAPPYPLCSIINSVDGTYPDPLANFQSALLGSEAHRSYQVRIIKLTSTQIRTDLCGYTAKDIAFPPSPCNAASPPFCLAADETFLITVGVSYSKENEINLTGVMLQP